MTDRRMLIGGEWCNARDGRTFDRFNPATGALASRAPAAGVADADAAIDAAH
ncbi:salicylaldehyde dehydrogenase, partial [Burkholderia orbicola]|nr:salicylaldehyde dehydrogenase [Burkholderia orbicola]